MILENRYLFVMTDDKVQPVSCETDSRHDSEKFQLEKKLFLNTTPNLYDGVFTTTQKKCLLLISTLMTLFRHIITTNDCSNMPCSAIRLPYG